MGKTVFFGGTFNPPHIAHRMMLEAVCALPQVSRVLVAPTNIPPHKAVAEVFASGEDRLNMCRLLCDGLEKAEVSDIEFRRDDKSYSYYTLSLLKETVDDLALLIGGDMVTSFTEWFNYREILGLCEIYAVRRKGTDSGEFEKKAEELRRLGGKVTVIEAELPNVSSTDIREAAETFDGRLEAAVPPNIIEYIKSNHLYGR